MRHSRKRCSVGLALGIVAALGTAGCRSTVRTTNTARSGSEQLLLNASVDSAVCAIDFLPLAGRLVYLDTKGLADDVDGYVAYRIRKQMGLCGVRLAESRDDAELIVELGLAAYGTDSHKMTCGLTESDQLPEINFCVRETQYGVTQLSLFALERESGAVIWHSVPMRADGYQRMSKVFGSRPIFTGTVEHPATRFQRRE